TFPLSTGKSCHVKRSDPTGKRGGPVRKHMGAIAHCVVIHFDLADGDKLTVASPTKPYFEKPIDTSVRDRLEIEILADDSTALKYFCDCVDSNRAHYWIPNQGNPPTSFFPP